MCRTKTKTKIATEVLVWKKTRDSDNDNNGMSRHVPLTSMKVYIIYSYIFREFMQ